MDFQQIISNLEKKQYQPVYFLTGEEAYYIDEISDFIEENVLTPDEKGFNQMILYGKDVDIQTIISNVKRFPMMADYQVVIIKEAQDLKKIEDLLPYFEKPLTSTILVINYKYKKLDLRTKFGKTVKSSNQVVFFESPKLYENKIPGWITEYLKKKGYRITVQACAILAENLGTDLSKVANELGKLIINVPVGTEINQTIIEENIGISKDFNVFELQNAIGRKDVLKANQIIQYFASNLGDNPMPKTTSSLFPFFIKLLIFNNLKDKTRGNATSVLGINPYFYDDYRIAAANYSVSKLHRVIAVLREYDMKSKGVDNNATFCNDGELYKEMIFKILH